MSAQTSQNAGDPSGEVANYDESPFDSSSSGGYGVNERGDAFSRANQTGGGSAGGHFSGGDAPADSNDDGEPSQPPSGASTPGGGFRGSSLSSFPGLPQRDYDADAQRGRDATEAAKREDAAKGVPGGQGLAANEEVRGSSFSENDARNIGA